MTRVICTWPCEHETIRLLAYTHFEADMHEQSSIPRVNKCTIGGMLVPTGGTLTIEHSDCAPEVR